jgi:Arc/MetJ-type ribon-helix-helix transcriptional regulator
MKLSVSLPKEDVEFLDRFARTRGYDSRSAVVHKAVRLLRSTELGEAYADAWSEWSQSGEAGVWDVAVGDGLATG